MNRFKDQRGQAMVMSVAFLIVLVGMAALVLDVGSWYRADRHAQTTADAAPSRARRTSDGAATARLLAIEYADKNEGGVTAGDVWSARHRARGDWNRPAEGRQALRAELVRYAAAACTGRPRRPSTSPRSSSTRSIPTWRTSGSPPSLSITTSPPAVAEAAAAGPKPRPRRPRPPSASSTSTGRTTTRDEHDGRLDPERFDQYMKLGDYNARTGNPFSSSHVGDSLLDC